MIPLIFPNGFAQTANIDKVFPMDEVEDYEIIAAFIISSVSIFVIIQIFRNLSKKPLKEIINTKIILFIILVLLLSNKSCT